MSTDAQPLSFEYLLEWPAEIAKLSDAQIEALVAPFFPLTRPPNSLPPMDTAIAGMDPELAARLAELKARPTLLQQLKAKAK